MWFGTFDAGVMRHSGGAWARYTVEDGLPSDEIAGMVTDGAGTQWALSRSGRLARFDGVRRYALPMRDSAAGRAMKTGARG